MLRLSCNFIVGLFLLLSALPHSRSPSKRSCSRHHAPPQSSSALVTSVLGTHLPLCTVPWEAFWTICACLAFCWVALHLVSWPRIKDAPSYGQSPEDFFWNGPAFVAIRTGYKIQLRSFASHKNGTAERTRRQPKRCPDLSGIAHSAVAPQAWGQSNRADRAGNENGQSDTVKRTCQEHADPIANCVENLEEEAPLTTALRNRTVDWLETTFSLNWDQFLLNRPKNKRALHQDSVRNCQRQ